MSEAPRNDIEKIRGYVPGMRAQNSQHGFERIVILLLGLLGHGKSSLINSCLWVMNDQRYRNLAGAGENSGGRTTQRRKHKLTDTILISDNRGFQTMKQREILEVFGQLRHLRLDEDIVEWDKDNIKETARCMPEVNKRPTEFLVPVIVHSCLCAIEEVEESSMRQLIRKCQEINKISPIVVITNVGSPNHRPEIEATIRSKFEEMGCRNRICLENYTENTKIRTGEADSKFISFLNACIDEAEKAIQQWERIDYPDAFVNHIANQIKEENEEKNKEMERLQKEKEEMTRKLEEKEKEMKRQLEEKEKEMKRQLKENEEMKRQLEEWRCLIL